MKLSAHFVQTCRRCFERWRQEVWPELLFGLSMVLFSLCCFAQVAWECHSPRRFDVETALLALMLLPVGLWFSYEALQSCLAHIREWFSATRKLPAERTLELDEATLCARLRAAAARDASGNWQEGEDFCLWTRAGGAFIGAHARGEGCYVLLFRRGGEPPLGLGRLKYWCAEEGMKFPTRFKRLKAEGCVFYRAGRIAVYPAERVQDFESEVLPLLSDSASAPTPSVP